MRRRCASGCARPRSTPVRRDRGQHRCHPRDPGAPPQVQGTGVHDRNPQRRNEFLRAGVRPATPLICEFIDEHRVVPICRALAVHGVQIAPRIYWVHRLAAPSKRRCGTPRSPGSWPESMSLDAEGKRPPSAYAVHHRARPELRPGPGPVRADGVRVRRHRVRGRRLCRPDPGWERSLTKDTGFVERALRHAVAFRARQIQQPVRGRDPPFGLCRGLR